MKLIGIRSKFLNQAGGICHMMIFKLLVLLVILGHYVQAQECETESPGGFIFPRVFYGTLHANLEYLTDYEITKETLRWALGSCGGSLEAVVQSMTKYYEFSYGIDMTALKHDAYKKYEDLKMSFGPISTYPGGETDLIVTDAFYEYVKFRNIPLFVAGWGVVANTTFSGRKGTLKSGERSVFAYLRFKDGNHDFCMEAASQVHDMPAIGDGIRALDFDVYNEYYGKGALQGISVLKAGILDQQFQIRFPSDPPTNF